MGTASGRWALLFLGLPCLCLLLCLLRRDATGRGWLMRRAAPAGFDESEARLYAHYAQAAFCERGALTTWTCGSPCEVPIQRGSVRMLGPGADWEVQGFVAAMPQGTARRRCIVAFRGSIALLNWVADASFTTMPWPPAGVNDTAWCPGCRVHKGFLMAYDELRADMLLAIRDLHCARVAVVGHSLGAAVATLAVSELRQRSMRVGPVYLFGSPRVGNGHFAKAFEAAAEHQGDVPSWRIVHFHDPVPRLWLTGPPFDYTHVPGEVYYIDKASTAFRVCNATGEDESCSAATPLWRCITDDHLTYMNMTFAHKRLPSECTGR
mmetsp:Transcript_40799/g.89200  ORF Transcript_40799/g.89200 Transcript_40799/m.89200 type:complete len:322 (-) Transcript_40799:266-1231(-)